MKLAQIEVTGIAGRISSRPLTGGWLVACTDADRERVIANEIAESLDSMDTESSILHVTRYFEILTRVRRPGIKIVYGLKALSEEDWGRIDLHRSRFCHDGIVVLVVDLETAEKMVINAPFLTSWIGPSMWEIDETIPTFSEEEIEERLAALRDWFKKSDAEVIALAEARQLPGDPNYAEWLVLLGRGDLIPTEEEKAELEEYLGGIYDFTDAGNLDAIVLDILEREFPKGVPVEYYSSFAARVRELNRDVYYKHLDATSHVYDDDGDDTVFIHDPPSED